MIARLLIVIIGVLGLVVTIFIAILDPEGSNYSMYFEPLETTRLEAHAVEQFSNTNVYPPEAASIIFWRNPRNERARLTLAENALNDDRIDQFLFLYTGLFRTDRNNKDIYARHLAGIVSARNLYKEVVPYLESQPEWSMSYLLSLLEYPKSNLDSIQSSFAVIPSAQSFLLGKMIVEGDYDQAYAAFQGFTGEELGNTGGVYDPNFSGLRGEPPFNWSYDNASEISEFVGLQSYFQGRGRPTLVSQILPLPKGEFSLKAEMSGNASPEIGRFEWVIECVDTKEMLLEHGPISLSSISQTFTAPFVIDSDTCPFVRLSLRGIAGAFPRRSEVLVSSVMIISRQTAFE